MYIAITRLLTAILFPEAVKWRFSDEEFDGLF